MQRIGIAASKIAPNSLLLYNLYVFGITFMVSLLLFLLAGAVIFVGLLLLRLILGPLMPSMDEHLWNMIFSVSLITLSVIVVVLSLCAVLKNVKFRK